MIFGINVILKWFIHFYRGNLLSNYIWNVLGYEKQDSIITRMMHSHTGECRVELMKHLPCN